MPGDRIDLGEIKLEMAKIKALVKMGSAKEPEDRLVDHRSQRADIEDTRPEPRATVPAYIRGGVFPIKARLVKLQSFENDPAVIDEVLLKFRAGLGNEALVYAGSLVNTIDQTTGALIAIGLAQQVNEWLLTAEEIDMLDWELSVATLTGFPRFLILYTE